MKRRLHRKLGIVFNNGDEKRYIPRAIPNRAPGSLGWLAFDQQFDQFLTLKQLDAVSEQSLSAEIVARQ